jgi:hypothetical protein
MNRQETTVAGDKIKRYGWISRNEPGKLVYAAKESLRIDQTYQRALNDAKRRRIAAEFNWAAFGVLTVARRPDGTMWVIDGQHRLGAAMSRSDIRDVPCVVFEFGGNVADEAVDFYLTNKNRKPLTGFEVFKAQVAGGDATAIAVNEMILASGRVVEVGADGRTVRCVGAIYKCMESDRGTMKALWPLICNISTGNIIDNRLVLGLFYLETHMEDEEGVQRSVLEAKNQNKIIEAGVAGVLRSIGAAAAYHNRGGDGVFARGILNLLNYKRRNTLRIRGSKLD